MENEMNSNENDFIFEVKPEPTEILNVTEKPQFALNRNKINGEIIIDYSNQENAFPVNVISSNNIKLENQFDIKSDVQAGDLNKLATNVSPGNFICNKSYCTKTKLRRYANRKSNKRRNMSVFSESIKIRKIRRNMFQMQSQIDEGRYKCNSCPKSFKTRMSMSRHAKLHYGRKEHKCNVCLKSFELRNTMLKHLGTHNKQTEYKCEICCKIFKLRGTLLKHLETHCKDRKHQCEICSKSFKTKTTMMQHAESHNEQNKFKCEICSRGFKARYSMLRHVKLHSDDTKVYVPKPITNQIANEGNDHKCDICFKNFKQKDCLTSHRKRHNEERNYVCGICSKGFKLFTDRSTHMKVHSEERKYKCELCFKTFKVRRNMMRHMNVHTKDGNYRCEVCVKSYKSMKYLFQHVKMQHSTKQAREQFFQCYTCGNDFYNKRNLLHHMKMHKKYSLRKMSRNVDVFNSKAGKVSVFQNSCFVDETNLPIKEENLEFGSYGDTMKINGLVDAKDFINVKLEPTDSQPQCLHNYIVVKEEKNFTDVISSIQKNEISNTNIEYYTPNKLEPSSISQCMSF